MRIRRIADLCTHVVRFVASGHRMESMLNLPNEAQFNAALCDAAMFFGLGDIRGATRVAGNANANFAIETKSGKYMLKFAFEHSAEDIEQEALFLERLLENNFPGRTFISSRADEIVFKKDSFNVVAMPWIEGDVAVDSITFCTAIGERLARLHEIGIDDLPDRRNWLRGDYIARRFRQIKSECPQDEDKFTAAIAHVNTYDFGSLPKVFAHGDIHAGNCLVNNDKLVAVLDWEEVGTVPAVLDLGMTIVNVCYPNDIFDVEYYRALMGSYESVRKLSGEENSLLAGAVKVSGLTFSIWAVLQYGSRFPDEERLGKAYHYWRRNMEEFVLPT